MRKGGTDQLIADFLALSLAIKEQLDQKGSRVSPVQMETLTDASKALHRYLTTWKKLELARRAARTRSNGKGARHRNDATRTASERRR